MHWVSFHAFCGGICVGGPPRANFALGKTDNFRPPLCLLVFLFAALIAIVFIHIYAVLQAKVLIYFTTVIAIGIIDAFIWLVHAHKESKTIKRRLHEKYIFQQNMRNQVIISVLLVVMLVTIFCQWQNTDSENREFFFDQTLTWFCHQHPSSTS